MVDVKKGKNRTLRVGVIGCGKIASLLDKDPKRSYISTHIGAYTACHSTKVVAICDSDLETIDQCSRQWGIKRVYSSYQDLISAENIDILSICTPPDTHYAILRQAVKCRSLKAVFCEKPIALTLSEARKMVALCRNKKIILQVNHQRRFDRMHQWLRDVLSRKTYGAIQQIRFYYSSGVMNYGTHMFDLLRFINGEIIATRAVRSQNPSEDPDDPNLDGEVEFSNGCRAVFQACNPRKFIMFELDVLTDKARFILKNNGLDLEFSRVGAHPKFSGYRGLVTQELKKFQGDRSDSFSRAVAALVECIGKKKKPLCSGEDGFKALAIAQGALASAGSGGRWTKL